MCVHVCVCVHMHVCVHMCESVCACVPLSLNRTVCISMGRGYSLKHWIANSSSRRCGNPWTLLPSTVEYQRALSSAGPMQVTQLLWLRLVQVLCRSHSCCELMLVSVPCPADCSTSLLPIFRLLHSACPLFHNVPGVAGCAGDTDDWVRAGQATVTHWHHCKWSWDRVNSCSL